MIASHAQLITRIERGLACRTLHDVVHAPGPSGALLKVVGVVGRELVVEGLLLLDCPPIQLRLPPPIGTPGIVVVLGLFVWE
jgi:hypothetical protein